MKIIKALEIYSLYKVMFGSQRKDNEMGIASFTNVSF